MANLSATDISRITNIVSQHSQSNDVRIKQFNGQPNEAVNFFEDYEYFANASEWDEERKKVKLGTYLTGAAREWYSLEIEGTNKTWTQVKDAFFSQFLPVDYEMHQRREFRNRKQRLFEPSANFVTSMRAILKKSNQTVPEREGVDFILGNMLPQLAERIIPMNPRTYNELKTFANRVEQAMKVVQDGTSPATDESIDTAINQLSLVSDKKPDYCPKCNFRLADRQSIRCYYCGKQGHMQAVCRFRIQDEYYEQMNAGLISGQPERPINILN